MAEIGRWIPVEAYGLTEEQAQEFQMGGGNFRKWEHFTPDFVGTKAQTLDVSEVFRLIGESQKVFREARISQPEGEVRFRNDLPITPFFIGDVHFGSIYTDHEKFKTFMQRIKECPNAFVVWMSNLVDNAIPAQYPAEMLVNAIPPDKQVVAMRKIIEEMNAAGKVLAAVTSACHEGWVFRHTGQVINALLFGFPDRHFPVLENGGRLHLKFPSWERIVALYHGVGPFESNFNETHAVRQMNRLRLNMEADIVVAAHKHFAAAEQVYEGNGEGHIKPVVYIRSGCFKGISETHDLWSIGRYASTGEVGGQSVTILPSLKLMDEHLDFDVGILAQECHLGRAIGEQEGLKMGKN